LKTGHEGEKRNLPEPSAPGISRFAVLIPHRDSRRLLENYRSSLFAAGCRGAYSFPVLVPLASLTRPLKPPELKALASFLREASLKNERSGKITTTAMTEVQSPGVFRFRGPALDLPPPPWSRIASDAVYRPFPVLVLCAALVGSEEPELKTALPDPPFIAFRAAAVANMVIKALPSGAEGYSFKWRIGKLFWLPRSGNKNFV
jgi:hypothetical protein